VYKPIAAILLSALGLAYFAPASANPGGVEVCRQNGAGVWSPTFIPAFAVKPGDLNPIPDGGCPAPCVEKPIDLDLSDNFQCTDGKIDICHATSAEGNPYVLISVDSAALAGHLDEQGAPHCEDTRCDIIPAPAEGCPPAEEPPCVGDECEPEEPPCEGDECEPPPSNTHSVPVLGNPVEWLLKKLN
jgi:hypothetical protein